MPANTPRSIPRRYYRNPQTGIGYGRAVLTGLALGMLGVVIAIVVIFG